MRDRTYWVYLLTNASTSVLYVGVTRDLERRVAEHAAGADPGSFTARYRVRRLVYAERFTSPRDAIRREKQLKGWTRAKKRALVDAANPAWADLRVGDGADGHRAQGSDAPVGGEPRGDGREDA